VVITEKRIRRKRENKTEPRTKRRKEKGRIVEMGLEKLD